MGRGCWQVVCSDAARHGVADGGGPREIRFARREVQRPRWFVIAPSWAPRPLRNPLSLSLFVTNSFSIRVLDTPPSRDTHATAHYRKRGQ